MFKRCFVFKTLFYLKKATHTKVINGLYRNREDNLIFKELPINTFIKEREVRLIDNDGTSLGIMSTDKALNIAYDKNMDLVLVSPNAKPVVCKILDYSKYRYDQIKKEKEDRKKQVNIEIKEIWLSATIDIGDMKTKAKKTRELLEDGNKVRLSIKMKGRQLAHPELSAEVLKKFFEMVEDVAIIDKDINRNGRSFAMIIAPKK